MLSPSDEIDHIVHHNQSNGVFEAKMLPFVSSESLLTTKERKQYILAEEAYKLKRGKEGEDHFVDMMMNENCGGMDDIVLHYHNVNAIDNDDNGEAVQEEEEEKFNKKHSQEVAKKTLSLKAMVANSRSLAAQTKWKSKYGFINDNSNSNDRDGDDQITEMMAITTSEVQTKQEKTSTTTSTSVGNGRNGCSRSNSEKRSKQLRKKKPPRPSFKKSSL